MVVSWRRAGHCEQFVSETMFFYFQYFSISTWFLTVFISLPLYVHTCCLPFH